jgi:hypothetical protein
LLVEPDPADLPSCADDDDPPTRAQVLLPALGELVGKPIHATHTDPQGVMTIINGSLLRVESYFEPWHSDNMQRLCLDDNTANGTAVIIDCDEIADITWTSPLQISLKIEFGESDLLLVDRSPAARMLHIEVQLAQFLGTEHPKMRRRRLAWPAAVVRAEHNAAEDGLQRQRLAHLLGFSRPLPPAARPLPFPGPTSHQAAAPPPSEAVCTSRWH